jgi:DNA mismatch endonuclease (patch repair protein)
MPGKLDPEARHALMARFRGKDTGPELLLRRTLCRFGIRGYRCHVATLPGRPDVVFTRWKVAIFVDGAFWHGHPSTFQFGSRGDYWDQKIARNQARDRLVNARLAEAGWSVLRIWDVELIKDPLGALGRVTRTLAAAGRQEQPASVA